MNNQLYMKKNTLMRVGFGLLVITAMVFFWIQKASTTPSVILTDNTKTHSPSLNTLPPNLAEFTKSTKPATSISESNPQPKKQNTFSVVATEILYPEEYDFGDVLNSSVTAAIGKPINIDVLDFTKTTVGDSIELEFDGNSYKAVVVEQDTFSVQTEDTNGLGEVHLFSFDSRINANDENTWKNQIRGHIGYNAQGVVDGEIRLQHSSGDYVIFINKQVAYYADEFKWQKEFSKQGYRVD